VNVRKQKCGADEADGDKSDTGAADEQLRPRQKDAERNAVKHPRRYRLPASSS